MKAIKYSVTISAEALSLDSIPGLVYQVIDKLREEAISGELTMDDGDNVCWSTKKENTLF